MELQGKTVIGVFTESWDAEGAFEDLKFAGFEGRVRYIQNEDQGIPNDTKALGGFQTYFARAHGFNSHEDFMDSDCVFSVNPEAEDYFAETYERKFHVILVQTADDIDKAIDIVHLHHGEVEVRHWAFFTAMAKDEHRIAGETFQQPPRLHPTTAIEMPRNSIL